MEMDKGDTLNTKTLSTENAQLGGFKDNTKGEIKSINTPLIPTKAELRAAKIEHIGTLVASIPFFSVFLLPVITYLVDRFNCLRSFLAVCAIGTTVSCALFLSTTNYPILLTSFIGLVAFQAPLNPLFDRRVLSMLPKETQLTNAVS
ncbi:hypothetical protein LSM04_006295 [Trypanosoma melophagium]|uniref:uncharacterized protein n=1 Tax=Trypanosoma melophagium TaxID=715481 RepID=UPI003519F634|nr:hypothetical protein LSM04_006295 [Trypanosoma melophagium]